MAKRRRKGIAEEEPAAAEAAPVAKRRRKGTAEEEPAAVEAAPAVEVQERLSIT